MPANQDSKREISLVTQSDATTPGISFRADSTAVQQPTSVEAVTEPTVQEIDFSGGISPDNLAGFRRALNGESRYSVVPIPGPGDTEPPPISVAPVEPPPVTIMPVPVEPPPGTEPPPIYTTPVEPPPIYFVPGAPKSPFALAAVIESMHGIASSVNVFGEVILGQVVAQEEDGAGEKEEAPRPEDPGARTGGSLGAEPDKKGGPIPQPFSWRLGGEPDPIELPCPSRTRLHDEGRFFARNVIWQSDVWYVDRGKKEYYFSERPDQADITSTSHPENIGAAPESIRDGTALEMAEGVLAEIDREAAKAFRRNWEKFVTGWMLYYPTLPENTLRQELENKMHIKCLAPCEERTIDILWYNYTSRANAREKTHIVEHTPNRKPGDKTYVTSGYWVWSEVLETIMYDYEVVFEVVCDP